jgi:plasmid replication initiation protein
MRGQALKTSQSMALKKHVNAIHCSNNLTLVQRKLFNALLFNAYPDLPYQQQFQIKGKDLYRLIGYNSKDTAKLKEALLGLITIAIEWNVIDCATGQEKKWKASSIIASAELSGGVCIYEYSKVMKDLLYQPDIYGQINIELVSQFKSGYGLALYENCIRYKGLPQTPWFPIETFRKLMGVFEEKYLAFKDFKKRVLDIGIAEVNNISPMTVTPEIERVNQKVTRIRFKLDKKTEHSFATVSAISVDDDLKRTLVDIFSFSGQMIEEVFAQYEASYIREKVEIIFQSESYIAGKIRGLTGYLIEALKKDYQTSQSSKVIIQKQKKIQDTQEKAQQQKHDAQRARYKEYVEKKINHYLSALTEEQHQALMETFKESLRQQTSFVQNWYAKHGLNHPAIKSSFNQFLLSERAEGIGPVVSFEEYIEFIG